ncbi:MAG: transposase family protein, partial [Propionibacteriaceae bacterium]|nr:transposase family protein [Propionibacteriaceae bacterium]
MLFKHITGLDDERLNELYCRIAEAFESRPSKRGGPNAALSLRTQLIATLMLLRHNLTEEMTAGIFGVSQPTMSRIKDKIEPVISEAHAFSEPGLEELARN